MSRMAAMERSGEVGWRDNASGRWLPERVFSAEGVERLMVNDHKRQNWTVSIQERDDSGTVSRRLDFASLCRKPLETKSQTLPKRRIRKKMENRRLRPHNPLVVCSNHTGPTSIWWRDFLCGSRFRGCGVGAPGSGTVSKTVSKRPGERPREGVERRPGRLGLRSSVGGHVEPLGGRRLHEKPPPAKGFLSPNRYRSAHHDGRCLVVPVAVTAGNKIESLRQWASGRCLSEDWAGVNSRQKGLRALKRPRGAGLLGIPLPSR